MTDTNAAFDSKGFGLRVQKKLIGKLSSKKLVKAFIDERTGDILDNINKILKEHYVNKKDAEKVIKNIIKVIVKIGINFRNDQFNEEEIKLAENFKERFHYLCLNIISFHEVEFTFDKSFLLQSVNECREILDRFISRHFTDKSKARVDMVFNAFTESSLIEQVFVRPSKYSTFLDRIVSDMHSLMDAGEL